MLVLKNPINQKLSIKYKGEDYTIPALGQMEVDDDVKMEVAEYWQKRIHNFLKLEEGKASKTNDEEENVPEDADGEEKDVAAQLDEMKREELDEIAKDLELNPEDYKNKKEIKDAILNSK